jgi:hypothetical protein
VTLVDPADPTAFIDYLGIGFPTDKAAALRPESVCDKKMDAASISHSPMLQRLLINFLLLGITQQNFKNY